MFFQEDKINDLLKCQQCNKRLVEPRTLPCGNWICVHCLEALTAEQAIDSTFKLKCCHCSKEHQTPEEGFPITKNLEKLLAIRPEEIFRSKLVEEFNSPLKSIKNNIDTLESNLDNGIEKIRDRCTLLRNQIQLKAESLIDQINKLSDQMQQEIDKYEKECLESFEKSTETKKILKSKINEAKSFYETSVKYLSQFKIDEDEVKQLIERAKQTQNQFNLLESYLSDVMFTNEFNEFEQNENQLDQSAIGWIRKKKFEYNSEIVSDDQKREVLKLCDFDSSLKWSLIYRASRDGRSAEAFHTKCDNKSKTLTVVKTTEGYIFGGYAEQAWDSSNQFKFDPNAVMFTLVNLSSVPDITFEWESINDTKGIYCHSSYGPTFLDKQENLSLPDLLIRFADDKSESYLSWIYESEDKNKLYYLTPERKFDWIELEVFCMIE
jgi:hypothetical protein